MQTYSKWSLKFHDRRIEAEYQAFDPLGDVAPELAIATWLAAYLLLDLFMSLIIASRATPFSYLCIEGLIASLLAGITFARRSKFFMNHHRLLTILISLVVEIGIAGMASVAGEGFGRTMFAAGLVMMMATSLFSVPWWLKVINAIGYGLLIIIMTQKSAYYNTTEVQAITNFVILTLILTTTASYSLERERRCRFVAESKAVEERKRYTLLLQNVFPESIVQRLNLLENGQKVIDHGHAVVLFIDIVGFSAYSAQKPVTAVVEMLEMLFAQFDAIIVRHGLVKIKTIGDSYMAVCGLPDPRDDAAEASAEAALELLEKLQELHKTKLTDLDVRIGIHIGPVMAGVIGTLRFTYDLWGDTVNVASRLESSGVAGKIQVSKEFARSVQGRFDCERRGHVHLKGRGEVETYFLVGARKSKNAAA